MTHLVKHAGVWKESEPYVKHNGVWKPLDEGHIKHAGVWKPFVEREIEYVSASNGDGLDNYVGFSSSARSYPLPPHQNGDLLVIFLHMGGRDLVNINGFTRHAYTDRPDYGSFTTLLYSKIGNGSETTFTGTLASASTVYSTSYTILVFRNASGIGKVAKYSAGEIAYQQITVSALPGTLASGSWATVFIPARTNKDISVSAPPSGMVWAEPSRLAMHTNGPVPGGVFGQRTAPLKTLMANVSITAEILRA